jgi:hypothetical protein
MFSIHVRYAEKKRRHFKTRREINNIVNLYTNILLDIIHCLGQHCINFLQV